MKTTNEIAKHIRGAFFGPNWTFSNVKDQLGDVSLEQACIRVDGLHTIAELTYHIFYFVQVQLRVLEGGPLEGSDKLSFDVPRFRTESEWNTFVDDALKAAERHADLVEKADVSFLEEICVDPKYGTWWANLIGLVEHTYYHLGQIAIIKRLATKEKHALQ